MAKNSIDAYGASGKSNVLFFEPENLHLVTDTTHPLYDERVHLPIEEGREGDRKYAFRAYRLVVLMDKRRMAYANAYNAETVKIRDSLAQGVSA